MAAARAGCRLHVARTPMKDDGLPGAWEIMNMDSHVDITLHPA